MSGTSRAGEHGERPRSVLSASLIALAVGIALLTRLGGALGYADFYGDQARDAFRLIDIAHGAWPTLGPETSLASYRLPPPYYDLIAPATLVPAMPALQALPNAIFSIASVALVYLVVLRLLSGAPAPRRTLVAALAALWWSVTFVDVFIANREWNPGPIPCLLLALVLLWSRQADPERTPADRVATAAGIGIALALLVGAHSSTLFVVPVAFVVMSAVHAASGRGRWVEPALSLAVASLALAPYWIGESARGWANTHAMIGTILEGGGKAAMGSADTGPAARLRNAFFGYTGAVGQFVAPQVPALLRKALAAASIVLPFAALRGYRGDRRALLGLAVIWAAYVFAAAHVAVIYPHFRLPLAFAAILMTAVVLGTTSATRTGRAMVAACAVFAAVSFAANVRVDAAFLASKFGPHRLPTPNEVALALQRVPATQRVCEVHDLYDDWLAQRYLDAYVVHAAHVFTTRCRANDYLVLPRYRYASETREEYETTDYRLVDLDARAIPARAGASATLETAAVAVTPQMQVVRLRATLAPKAQIGTAP